MKAVVMAGGEGTRLRPLTCNIPKPMARLCGRPVLCYILDLLAQNGVDEVYLTLKYLPQEVTSYFNQGNYCGMQLHFVEEEIPLGTAGGVKNAARGFQEPFLVISGDALCDYQLREAVAFHNASGAQATLVTAQVEDPREYGLVRLEEDGRVEGFIEKPGWGQAVSDLANTGIYIVDPACLALVPEGRPFDFAKDLFPEMMRRGMPLYGYRAEGYWCDIGDLRAYLQCQRDLLAGKVKARFAPQIAQGIFAKGELPKGDFHLIPPVYIGENVEIAPGAQIGPDCVIDDHCFVGPGAKARFSVLLESAYLAADATLTGAILCSGASVKRGGSMFEGSAVGTQAVVGAGASVRPDVLIWPGKTVGDGAVVSENVKYGGVRHEIFDDGGVGGDSGIEVTAEIAARIGASIGSSKAGKRVGIACDARRGAQALAYGLMSGLLSVGSHVWNFGECFEAQLSFFTSFCGLGVGLFITGGEEAGIRICGEGGLPISRALERDIESRFAKGEFNRCASENCRDVSDMSSIQMMYQQELCRTAPAGLLGKQARVQCANDRITMLLGDCLGRLECKEGDMVLHVNRHGTKLSVSTPETGLVEFDRLLAVCTLYELQSGHDVALPYDAPRLLNTIAQGYERKVLRYLISPADNSDARARTVSASQLWVRDGLFMAVKLLAIMKERGLSLSQLLSELPDFSVARQVVEVDILPSRLADFFSSQGEEVTNAEEGITLSRGDGSLLITPSHSGRKLRLVAEAANMEAAQELCSQIENELRAGMSLDRKDEAR